MLRAIRPLFLAVLACSGFALRAQAGMLVPSSTGQPDQAVLSIRSMTVDVDIVRGYARVNVRQVFENHTRTAQEGTYRFTLPPSAAVGDFAIWDGFQRIPGVILEKKRARSIYQELARERIDPGLLQQGEEDDGDGPAGSRPSGGAPFTVAVAPIPPLATKRLELQFQEEVPFIRALGEFRLALRPPEGEPPVAGTLTVRVKLEDGTFVPVPWGLPLRTAPEGAAFSGHNVKLDRDLVLRISPVKAMPLHLSAFRNPEGVLPDGLALAPWERPAEVPPEKDGFFLLEASPFLAAGGPSAPGRTGVALAILFDTSLRNRWSGLEHGYAQLVNVLKALGKDDRFALIPFDQTPGETGGLRPATARDIEAALSALRERTLGPEADLLPAIAAARKTVGDHGRILLLASGQWTTGYAAIKAALGPVPLFTSVTSGASGRGLLSASTLELRPAATELEGDLFLRKVLDPRTAVVASRAKPAAGAPFTVAGGEPGLRDVYPVLVQPLEPGSLSGWVGRYRTPVPRLRFTLASRLFPGGAAFLDGALPDKALEARDLPRRWARARVDDLLERIEREGERREWVEEIIDLAKRYKFVTPYTAFLAAPRALLRPRRIQPGDPVLRVECDPGTVAATALFHFGLELDLVQSPGTRLWEGRFLVPTGLPDGRYPVRILIRDRSGARVMETRHYVLDGKAPGIVPQIPASARAGEPVRIGARTDKDVVLLFARIGDGPPVPLRWDAAEKRCVGQLLCPDGRTGPCEVVFEAVDAAKNRGFARAVLQVRP